MERGKSRQREYAPADDRDLPLIQIAGLPRNARFSMSSSRSRYLLRHLRSLTHAISATDPEFVQTENRLIAATDALTAATEELERLALDLEALPNEQKRRAKQLISTLNKILDKPQTGRTALQPKAIDSQTGPVSLRQILTATGRSISWLRPIVAELEPIGKEKTGAKLYDRADVERAVKSRACGAYAVEAVVVDWSRRP